ncbi:glycosyltransferase family 9 protein [Neisseriaceae bacterium TC5R-5]|nr:glycosyltransferase family 9 protein [Neisseriaceae bacterium TC5R-5]
MFKRILLIRRDNIGDLVCTTPLILALRQHFPQAQLDVLVNSYNAPVLQGHPAIDQLYVYTKAKHRAAGETLLGVYGRRLKLMLTLRVQRYDLVVLANADGLQRSRRWARQLKAKQVLGFCEPNDPVASYIDYPVRLPVGTVHQVEQNMALMEPLLSSPLAIPALQVQASSAARQVALASLQSAGFTLDRPVLGLHISARKPSQRWPIERFIALAHALVERYPSCQLLLFWSPGRADNPFHPGDDDKAAAIIQACRDLPLLAMPSLHLDELIGGLSLLDCLICSDGGAMHLAAGLAKPIVCLFGDSDAGHWHPWGVPYQLLQPASLDVSDVTVEQVLLAYSKLQSMPAACDQVEVLE